MLCKLKRDSLVVYGKREPGQLIIKGEKFWVNAEWNYINLPEEIKKEIKESMKFVKRMRVLRFLNPDEKYFVEILQPYERKYKGKTIYWWLKKVCKKVK